ncbi:sialyltransferase [Chloropicon primus]|uniref:Sialyltransferase n=1 Tax=Chloropicon primus TaxID=1764295 RepID=A0A5B8MNG9_9CHLO|nr:sialyltransferase [Chloropicon primus]|eukprot:QDZ20870.1 sialyltransferase [Chloropicon primus]
MKGKSGLRTLFVALFTCIFTVTLLHLSYFDNWVHQKLLRDPRHARDNVLNVISDYSLVVLNELVEMDVDFTLFAPTTRALGLKLENASSCVLADFFEDHIVYERIVTSSVPDGESGKRYESASGDDLILKRTEEQLMVKDVPVLYDNVVVGTRGIVHVVDALLSDVNMAQGGVAEAGGVASDQAASDQVVAASGGAGDAKKGDKRNLPKNPFDVENLNKVKNIEMCNGHGFVGEDEKCHCASLYTGDDCSEVVHVPTLEGIVGHSPIVFNKQKFQGMDEIMVRTEAKTLTMLPKVTQAAKKSIMQVLPQDDPFHGRVFNVCSLVGSSGSLLYFENGPEIDRSDLVIRFNHAPTKMFEKYVGSRTDLRISNGEHLGFNERPNERSFHHLRSKSFLARMLLYEKHFGKKRDMPYLVHPGFTEYVANASIPYIASSGYFAILMAMEVCSHVNLYGFHSSFNQGSRHHYFNNEVPANPNRDTSEYERLKKLEDHGLIKFAEPCLHECYGSSSDCETCFGMPMYKVTAMQKLSEKQIKMAEKLEADRLKFRLWEAVPERMWEWDEVKGLIKKQQRRGGKKGRGGKGKHLRRVLLQDSDEDDC